MTKRRYIFIGTPIACILTIIVSLVISQPGKDTKGRKENPAQENPAIYDPVYNKSNQGTVTQTVQDLSIPNYDEKGEEFLIMRGKDTILLDNDMYKIITPEIEVRDTTNTESGTQSVFITSDNGEMNRVTNEGYLSENVIIHFDLETKLNTDYMRYLPEKKLVSTDDFVTIHGQGIVITGQGCEIDLANKKMWIKKNAEMEMDGVKNDLFFLSKDDVDDTASLEETDTKEMPLEKTYIQSSGQLVFDRSADANIMTFNDNVQTKRGSATVYSDKLVIFLNQKTKKTEQAIASGNVLASQGTKIAKGSFLTWDVNTQSAILEDAQKAEFVNDVLSIDALKMIFYRDTGKIDVPSSGSLKAKIREKSKEKDTTARTDKPDTNINVKWEGKMNFLDGTREASFEKNIEVRRGNSTLSCDNLYVVFNENDFSMQNMKATEKIHIIDKKGSLYNEAVGDQVTWNAKNKVTTLRGHPFAILREGNRRQIFSPKVLFYEDRNSVLCEGKGNLYEKGEEGVEESDVTVDWSKRMTYNDDLKKVSFFEEVQATRGGQKLNGDQIDAYLNDSQKISKIIATGNTYFFSKVLHGCEGFGSFLIWDLVQDIAIMTGNPKAELRKEGSKTFSDKVYFNMAENRVTWEGRPHWQLQNSKK